MTRARHVALVSVLGASLAGAAPVAADGDVVPARPDVGSTLAIASLVEPARTAARGRLCSSHWSGMFTPSVSAQDFETAFDQYDTVAADDFRVDRRCRARSLQVVSDTGGSAGTPETATVSFHRDGGDRPGRTIWEDEVDVVGQYDLAMELDPPMRLRPGRSYWVAVQLDLSFSEEGHISLGTYYPDQLAPMTWKNPGDGFERGCIDWTPAVDCWEEWRGGLALQIGTRFDPDAPTPEERS